MTVFDVVVVAGREALPVGGVSHAIDHFDVTFDDETLVADAGLIVPATRIEDVPSSVELR
jgi:hypothetical protein